MYKTIGLDIDNTLTHIDVALEKIADEFNLETISVEDVYDYDLCVCFGISGEHTQRFWNEREFEIITESKLAEERYKQILHKFGTRLSKYHIITSRHEKYRKLTEDWLKKNNIEYDKLIMTGGESKIPYLKDLKIELMVDDLPSLFHDVYNNDDVKTHMACVRYPYNLEAPRKYLMDLQGNLLTD